MISLTVETTIAFNTEEEFWKFVDGNECAKVIGFPDEIKEAFKQTPLPVQVVTPRPSTGGTVTVSQISIKKWGY